MQIVHFDVTQDIPVVDARVYGPLGSQTVRLVLDARAGTTQLDTALVEDLGYSVSDAIRQIQVQGPAGDSQDGYQIILKQLTLFGRKFVNIPIGVYDFDNFDKYGIDGLLGFEIIKQLHLEMDGPNGLLKIF